MNSHERGWLIGKGAASADPRGLLSLDERPGAGLPDYSAAAGECAVWMERH